MSGSIPESLRIRKRCCSTPASKLLRLLLRLICPSVLMFFPASPARAQSDLPITLAVGTHALTVPWYPGPTMDRWNPDFLVGTDQAWKSGAQWRLSYGISLGFFRHHWWMTGVSVVPELGIGRRLPGGLYVDLRLGLGYMHYFWRRNSLELEGGRYVQTTDWGGPSVLFPLSATISYRGARDGPLKVAPFLSARWAVQGMFLEEVPAMTHFSLLGGLRIDRGLGEHTGGG